MSRKKLIKVPLVLLCFLLAIFTPPVRAQQNSLSRLDQAKQLFQHENFEEALELFKQLRRQQPQSPEIAYYLGLTYKRLQDYVSAKPHLIDACNLLPPFEAAFPELIEVLYQYNQLEEARKWIRRAEKDFIAPAQVAFLKGLVLAKEGADLSAAIRAFEDAEKLDGSLSASVQYQKGMAYAQMKDYRTAEGMFKEIVVKDPASDLAAYSNEYLDAIKRSRQAERPFRGSVGYAFQYDDNVVFKPNNNALAASVSDEDDYVHVVTAQGEYTHELSGDFALKAGYSVYGSHHDDIGYYDMRSYDFPLQAVWYGTDVTVSFPVHYNYVSVNEERYLETVGASTVANIMLARDKMVQLQTTFNHRDYFWAPDQSDDRMDGCEYLGALGMYDFFGSKLDGFVSLRYAISYEDTRGRNWTYVGNRLTFSSGVPFCRKYAWNFVADLQRQDFLNRNTTYDKERYDNVVTVSNLVSWEAVRDFEVNLQHTFTCDGASIGVYKYTKNVYSIGTRYRF